MIWYHREQHHWPLDGFLVSGLQLFRHRLRKVVKVLVLFVLELVQNPFEHGAEDLSLSFAVGNLIQGQARKDVGVEREMLTIYE